MTWQNKHLSARIVKFELYRVFPTFSYMSSIQGFILYFISRVHVLLHELPKKKRVTLNIYNAKNKIHLVDFLYCLGFKILWKDFFFTVAFLFELFPISKIDLFLFLCSRKLGNTLYMRETIVGCSKELFHSTTTRENGTRVSVGLVTCRH